MKRILALDLGIKSLGVSISDENNLIAIPLENYFFEAGVIDFPLQKVRKYLQEYEISLVLLGFPLKTSGELSTISSFIKTFSIELNNIIKIKLVDERFSTKRGQELLNKNQLNKFKTQKDLLASWVLLTDYLNYNFKKEEKV